MADRHVEEFAPLEAVMAQYDAMWPHSTAEERGTYMFTMRHALSEIDHAGFEVVRRG